MRVATIDFGLAAAVASRPATGATYINTLNACRKGWTINWSDKEDLKAALTAIRGEGYGRVRRIR